VEEENDETLLLLEEEEEEEERKAKLLSRSESHLASEKRRRANINDGFVMLRGVVPGCQPCHSKAEILKKAVNHIKQLSAKKSAETSAEGTGQQGSAEDDDDENKPTKEQSKVNFLNKFAEKIVKQRDQAQKELDVQRQLVNMFMSVLSSSPQLCNTKEVQYCFTVAAEQLRQYPLSIVPVQTPFTTAPAASGMQQPSPQLQLQPQPSQPQPQLTTTINPVSAAPKGGINASVQAATLLAVKRKLNGGNLNKGDEPNNKKLKLAESSTQS